MINRLGSLFSYFLIPSIFFRIELILALWPHAEQPGTVSCATLSAAKATLPKNAKIKIITKILDIFFILHLF
jgi:hypothetical protein